MTQLNPYISFDGNTEEAFNFYASVFGTEIKGILRWGDNPDCGSFSDEDKKKVMHIALPIGKSVLMASDHVPFGPPFQAGNNFQIAVSPVSREDSDRIFGALAAGGNVSLPMATSFWGGYFGMLTDKFGIQWMINYEENSKPVA